VSLEEAHPVTFVDGALRVQISDHVSLAPAVKTWSTWLAPGPASLYHDLRGLLPSLAVPEIPKENEDPRLLELESHLLPRLFPDLDLEPSVEVTRRANLASLNSKQMLLSPLSQENNEGSSFSLTNRKRKSVSLARLCKPPAQSQNGKTSHKSVLSTSKDLIDYDNEEEDDSTMMMKARSSSSGSTDLSFVSQWVQKKEFFPRFQLLTFVQEWKRKKAAGDVQVLQTVGEHPGGSKKRQKKSNTPATPTVASPILPQAPTLNLGPTKRCIRTLRFEQEINKGEPLDHFFI
jgi:hypothetical protein